MSGERWGQDIDRDKIPLDYSLSDHSLILKVKGGHKTLATVCPQAGSFYPVVRCRCWRSTPKNAPESPCLKYPKPFSVSYFLPGTVSH